MRLGEKLARFAVAQTLEAVDAVGPVDAAAELGRASEPAREQWRRDDVRAGIDRLERRAPIARPVLSSAAPPSLMETLPGSAVATPHGSTWVATTQHGAHERIGAVPFARALEADYGHLERITGDARLAGFDARKALFLDIEATGLEHGSGTLAFLIGLGFFEGDVLRLEQVVLRDHDEEAAFLRLVWDAVERSPYLVSFNGKSFDLTVLQNRMVMHRMASREECQLKLRPHLDLLHVARSIYKGAWSDVRLQTLEARVIEFVREDDMPGSLAPTCWFAWLKDGDPRPLAGIARHNRFDVLSMVALAGVLAKEAEPRPDAGRPSLVALNLARLYLRRKGFAEALRILEDWPPLFDFAERVMALELTATAARRLGDVARQVRALENLIALAPARDDVARQLARARRRLVARPSRH